MNHSKTFIDQSSRIQKIKQDALNLGKKNYLPPFEKTDNTIKKALTTTRSGGYIVPPKVVNRIIK